jgi:hypothetical protein
MMAAPGISSSVMTPGKGKSGECIRASATDNTTVTASQIPVGATSGHISFTFGHISFAFGHISFAFGQTSFAFGRICSHEGRRKLSGDGILTFRHSLGRVMLTISVWVR